MELTTLAFNKGDFFLLFLFFFVTRPNQLLGPWASSTLLQFEPYDLSWGQPCQLALCILFREYNVTGLISYLPSQKKFSEIIKTFVPFLL